MGTVYKETFTKPLPAGAKIIVRKGQRLAQWQDAKGKTRTAQACMRHSTIDLTMNVYTDPKLLDVAGAVESLPALPLGAKDRQADSARIAASATGTDNSTPSPLVPVLVPTTGKPCITLAILDKTTDNRGEGRKAGAVAVSAYPVKRKDPLTSAVNGPCKSGRLDLNQRPLGPKPDSDDSETPILQGFTPTPSPVCTRVCTSKPENDNADTYYATLAGTPSQAAGTVAADGGRNESEGADEGDRLDKLAAVLLTLSPAERERLAAMLTAHQGTRGTA
jgi:hypothetical protein